MVHRFRFGVQTGPFGDPTKLRSFARRIEDLGYAELFSSDHINGGGMNNVDPFLPLLVAAEATSELRFGPLVLNNEFHNPALLARTAASFDLLTGGRLLLGLGTGYAQDEHDAIGMPLRAPGPRVTRLAESISVLRSLLDTGAARLDGQQVSVAVDDLGVRPAQDRVPLLVGGHGRRVVSLAAETADVFQFTGLGHDPATGQPSVAGFAVAELAERHRWLRQAAGDRFPHLELSALVQRSLITDNQEDLSTAAGELADRLGPHAGLADETPFLLLGSVSAVVDKLHRLRDELGIHHYVVRDPDNFAPVVSALNGA
jgi:probable F420-dependent oxidoreductase